MYVLNYWHTVSDYAEWKRIFDSRPARPRGVRRTPASASSDLWMTRTR